LSESAALVKLCNSTTRVKARIVSNLSISIIQYIYTVFPIIPYLSNKY
jgi:hypothetical protein